MMRPGEGNVTGQERPSPAEPRLRTWTSQFYDLTWTTLQAMARLPVIPVPGFRFQPIDAGEVATRLVGLALGTPAGRVPDMAGPRVYPMAELLRGYLRATHRHRLIVPAWMPGMAARAFRDGANLAPDRAVGRLTWEEYVAARVRSLTGSKLVAA